MCLDFSGLPGQVKTTLTPVDIGKTIAISPAFHLKMVMGWVCPEWKGMVCLEVMKIWAFPKNRGILLPKWMVYFMENPIKMDDLGVPLFLETQFHEKQL